MREGQISSAQLETVVYANDRFNQRLPAPPNSTGTRATLPCSAAADCVQCWSALQQAASKLHTVLSPMQLAALESASKHTCSAAEPDCLAGAAEPRAGFALGDGAGIGKGRQIGAIIKVRQGCCHRFRCPVLSARAVQLLYQLLASPDPCLQLGELNEPGRNLSPLPLEDEENPVQAPSETQPSLSQALAVQDHWRKGNERILWVSVSTDLKFDAERDLADVGAKEIPLIPKASLIILS